jgi:hypothetical protein
MANKKIALLNSEKQELEKTCNDFSVLKIAFQLEKDKLINKLEDT